uniref:Uncharacterized protein n=1 Tax=Tanacetum cinerariifolium TaxID=118510 RepID=A0A6L2LEF3_TANCI|nr:hypothetical protein [Tanacetum cinerariifolium]
MVLLYIGCSTDESRWYRCTLDVQRMSRDDIILTTTNKSHTLLPSQPPTDHTIIMKMVPYEAFLCRYGARDVVLRESYKPKTREERVCLLVSSPGASTTPSYSLGPSTPPSYSSGPSTPQSYSLRPSEKARCSNCKLVLGKIKVLEATVDMYMHPEQHTLNSTALLREVYNDMRKLGLE